MYPAGSTWRLGRAGNRPADRARAAAGCGPTRRRSSPGRSPSCWRSWGDGFPRGTLTGQPWLAAPVVAERPELFILGSSGYGTRFAAVNGMSAVFAHHMSPDLAFGALREYRRDFTPRSEGATPYLAMSVLAFASHDDEAIGEFEAAWTLTLQNLRRGEREPRGARKRCASSPGRPSSAPAATTTAGWSPASPRSSPSASWR